ncbi:MAG: hypothetical protein ACK4PI_09645 [Tepidisphaerales bacterium]
MRPTLLAWAMTSLSVAANAVATPAVAAAGPLPERFFPFVIPWDDAVPDVATDLSRLNHVGGELPRIEVRDGQFFEAGTDRRVRFWGTNIGADEAFPDRASADAVAKRMAKYGINVVRLHHLDNPWAVQYRGSLWDPTQAKRVIDPVQLDKLHYLIAALARNGIYVNLNLKVSKELSAADGVPPGTEELSRGMSLAFQKKVDRFHPFFIEHQKAFARQLLTTPNPYRGGLTPAEDPAVAFIEINNENAAAGWPGEEPGAGLAELPAVFRDELRRQWVAFLRERYPSTAAMRAAWERPPGDAPAGAAVTLPGPTGWFAVSPGDTQVAVEAVGGEAGGGGGGTARFTVSKTTGTDWHAQGILPLPPLTPNAFYTLHFEASAEPPRAMRVSVDRNEPPWDNQGLNATVRLGPEFTSHRLVFRAGDAAVQRLALQLGTATGTVSVRHVRLEPGVAGVALPAGASLEAGEVPFPGGDALPGVRADWQRFVTEVDRRFAEEMLDFLTGELKVRGLIADTQIQWGGLGALTREARMHWTDSHSYWNHPIFPAGDWDPVNWRVPQSDLTTALARGELGTLGDLARHRVAGKPFSVSEYDHPAPNDFNSEMIPLLVAFGALQDWDKLYTFSYAGYGPDKATDRIQGFFDQSSHPGKWAFNPSAALVFRTGLLEPLPADVTLEVPSDVHASLWTVGEAWRAAGTMPSPMSHRLAVRSDPAADAVSMHRAARSAATTPLRAELTGRGGVVVLEAPKVVAMTGFVGGRREQAGGFTFEFGEFGNGFASLMLVPLDGQSLSESRRLLLTVMGRAENLEMGWNADRTSVGERWGRGPVHVEGVPLVLRTGAGVRYDVFPLDVDGRRRAAIGGMALQLGPQHRTVWYELVRRP